MQITLNGKSYELQKPASVQELLDLLALEKSKIAIERNREIVPRSLYAQTTLEAGDAVEIVTFIGGG